MIGGKILEALQSHAGETDDVLRNGVRNPQVDDLKGGAVADMREADDRRGRGDARDESRQSGREIGKAGQRRRLSAEARRERIGARRMAPEYDQVARMLLELLRNVARQGAGSDDADRPIEAPDAASGLPRVGGREALESRVSARLRASGEGAPKEARERRRQSMVRVRDVHSGAELRLDLGFADESGIQPRGDMEEMSDCVFGASARRGPSEARAL